MFDPSIVWPFYTADCPPLTTSAVGAVCHIWSDRLRQHAAGKFGGGEGYLSLTTSGLHPRTTTTYAEIHSSDCYSGITSICSVLNWVAVKSRPNTAPSYQAILARVSIAKQVQIWCRTRETSGSWCLLTSWLASSFLGLYRFPSNSVTQWWMKVPTLAKMVWGYKLFRSDWG